MPRLSNSPTLNNNTLTYDAKFVVINDPIQQANVALISANSFYSNVKYTVSFANTTILSNVVFSNVSFTPTNSTINVAKGTVWFDSNYMYVATSNNNVKRVSLSSF